MISLRFLQGKEKRPVIVVELEGASVLAMVVPMMCERFLVDVDDTSLAVYEFILGLSFQFDASLIS